MAIKEFNRAQIAVAFDVNLTTVDKWRRSGCPAEQQGKNVVFTVRAVSDWLRGRDSASNDALDLSQERAKLTKLQAEKATLELEQQRGNLIPMELVIEGWQGLLANARAKLLALPPKFAAQAVGADNYLEIEQLSKDLIYEALDELAHDGLPDEYTKRIESIAADLESAAEANS
jgi:terminase small subunit / prophage DNA-packing protein